jgi:hypothetical protein
MHAALKRNHCDVFGPPHFIFVERFVLFSQTEGIVKGAEEKG